MISREGGSPTVITEAGKVPLAAAKRPPLSYCESLHCAEWGSDEGVSAHFFLYQVFEIQCVSHTYSIS